MTQVCVVLQQQSIVLVVFACFVFELVNEQGFLLWLIHAVLSLSFADLRKFRSYKGGSVRDLLRAMRNKVSVYFNDYDKLCL